ncbi:MULTISPECIES: hypothetical protein [unclassified Streptomyces]|uniref:hypothetical protein n=1 Tax=unclassified Streptomyces TaxID=2593676 RepID=UPI0038181645
MTAESEGGTTAGAVTTTDGGTRARIPETVSRWARWVVTTYAVLLGAVGLLDLFTANGFDARTTGGALAVACLSAAAAIAHCFRPHGALRWAAAVVAACVLLLVDGWLLASITSDLVAQWHLVTMLVIVMVSFAATCVVLVHDMDVARTRARRMSVRLRRAAGPSNEHGATLAAAVIAALSGLVAAALSFPQFWYSARYEPSMEPTVVSVHQSFDQIRRRDGRLEITASVTLENKGKSSADVIASLYEITGVTTEKISAPPRGRLDDDAWRSTVVDGPGPAARYNSVAPPLPPELIQAGPLTWDNVVLEPGESTQATLVAFAPADRFDLLRITTDFAAAPLERVSTDGGRTEAVRPGSCAGATGQRTTWPLERQSLMERLTTSDQDLVATWITHQEHDAADAGQWWPAYPTFNVQITHRNARCDQVIVPRTDLEDRAKLAKFGALTEAVPPRG